MRITLAQYLLLVGGSRVSIHCTSRDVTLQFQLGVLIHSAGQGRGITVRANTPHDIVVKPIEETEGEGFSVRKPFAGDEFRCFLGGQSSGCHTAKDKVALLNYAVGVQTDAEGTGDN
ncbi:hypothetical protein PoMZ_07893 [Pyricularia oryzae]|uniref:Uncharacterized protein n=1 Tax=Pyricularia oryzae TaxID=318829 RepID=A0A4P7NG89_PYROR|nr:hypothetical protein PoMZ_07893 [Pyricularia oryzae]